MLGCVKVVVVAVVLLQVHFSLCLNLRQTADVIRSLGRRDAPGSTFHFTRVSKQDLGDVYKVRVEYEADSKPTTVFVWTDGTDMPQTVQTTGLGAVEVEVPKRVSQELLRYATLVVGYPDYYFMASLQLVDTPDSVQVPRIVGHVAQGTDVIFAPGSDPILDVSLKAEGNISVMDDVYFHYEVMIKSDTEENRVDRYHNPGDQRGDSPVWLELVSDEGQEGGRQATFLINSTLADPRGVLRLSGQVQLNCSDTCLVERVIVSAMVRFHSQEHSRPFPQGFLGFIHDQYSPDHSTAVCDVKDSRDCRLICEALGSDPVTVEFSRVLPTGDITPAEDMVVSLGLWSLANLMFSDVTYADAGAYRCTARSVSGEISQDVELAVIWAASIDRELSHVTRFDNGTVAATCVAEGNPSPNVTFDTYMFYDANPGDYDITMTNLDENTTRADIRVTNPDLVQSLYSFECRATNVQSHVVFGFTDYMSLYVDESYDTGNFSFYG